jgi:long-chain fatty acid transport protein
MTKSGRRGAIAPLREGGHEMTRQQRRKCALAGAVASVFGTAVLPAAAAGFFLPYQGASSIGNALAGSAALGEDASTVFFNPAGMARLDTAQVALAGHYVHPVPQFTNQGSTLFIPPATTVPLSGNSGAGVDSLLPNLFAVVPIGQWALGLGISAPWGSQTEYESTWAGRYSSLSSEITSLNVNPSVSYRFNEQWSAGVGLSYQKFATEFVRAQYFGGVPSPATDGRARIEGDGDGYGYNFGVLWEATPQTRLGASFRSAIEYSLSGTQTVKTAAGTTVPGFSGSVTANLHTPALAQLSIAHELSDRWTLLGDVMWTEWSKLQRIDIVCDCGSTSSLTLKFQDTWRFAAAANYRVNDAWLLRFGVAWDQSPVQEAALRTTNLPDSDRTWLSVGARWDLGRHHRLDAAYAHVFIDSTTIGNTQPLALGLSTTVNGNYSNRADILSVQYSFLF